MNVQLHLNLLAFMFQIQSAIKGPYAPVWKVTTKIKDFVSKNLTSVSNLLYLLIHYIMLVTLRFFSHKNRYNMFSNKYMRNAACIL